MTAPHCRIGWVTPKNGGARVRVLGEKSKDDALATLSDFVRSLHEEEERPIAIAAVALWKDSAKAALGYRASWRSDSISLPVSILPILMRELLARSMAKTETEYAILRKIGYDTEDPEGAA